MFVSLPNNANLTCSTLVNEKSLELPDHIISNFTCRIPPDPLVTPKF